MSIRYPYLPEGRRFTYVPADDPAMSMAREHARTHSLDKVMPAAVVLVKDGEVIGIGANGSDYHETHPCRRIELGCRSGEGYDLCEGCHPKNHAEPTAIADARARGNATAGATAYMWGHWWCCRDCWEAMEAAGIAGVCLLEGSEILFNKEHPGNIVGRQFAEAATISE